MLQRYVQTAGMNTPRINTKKQNTARYVKIKNIKEAGRSDVYNMEVKNHHNFSICGGFIVHNCMDAVRYFCYTILRSNKVKVKTFKGGV